MNDIFEIKLNVKENDLSCAKFEEEGENGVYWKCIVGGLYEI